MNSGDYKYSLRGYDDKSVEYYEARSKGSYASNLK
jgi:hypothetical protein